MPEINVEIGGRTYAVSCEPGEEKALHHAASLLDKEAGAIQSAIGRLPESRMLLMAGLMLSDKASAWEKRSARSRS